MKKVLYKIIKIELKDGLIENYRLKKWFKVGTASDISAFLLQKGEEEFVHYNRNALSKLMGKIGEGETGKHILECLLSIFRGERREVYEKLYATIIEEISNLNYAIYSSERWKTLSAFFTSNGMFQVGLLCRDKAKENLLNRKFHWGDTWRKAIVYLEDREFEKALVLIKKIEKKVFLNAIIKEEVRVLNLYYELLAENEGNVKVLLEKQDNEFGDLVTNKDLLVIGPAPLKDGFPFEEKDYIVIRNNERREPDDESYLNDRKTDITYYNGGGIEWIKTNKKLEFLNQFKYVVLKNRCVWNENSMRVRKTPPMDDMLFIGTMNVLPIMVLDLQQFNINSLRICGNNLFLSENPYNKNYLSAELDLGTCKQWRAFATHNMFSQLLFLRNSYLNNRFIPDEELKSVLNTSLKDYATKMEKIYVK